MQHPPVANFHDTPLSLSTSTWWLLPGRGSAHRRLSHSSGMVISRPSSPAKIRLHPARMFIDDLKQKSPLFAGFGDNSTTLWNRSVNSAFDFVNKKIYQIIQSLNYPSLLEPPFNRKDRLTFMILEPGHNLRTMGGSGVPIYACGLSCSKKTNMDSEVLSNHQMA